MTLFAFASSLVVFSSFVFSASNRHAAVGARDIGLRTLGTKELLCAWVQYHFGAFLRSFSAFQGSSMIIKCHLCLPFEEHEMTITCKNKISRKCPSTSNKHVLICAPMSASPTSKFQFQYGNLCFQYTHIYICIYFYP